MNSSLRSSASYVEVDLDALTKDNKVDYAVCYGEFMYETSSWKYARRVVCKVEKPTDQMTYMYTLIVKNGPFARRCHQVLHQPRPHGELYQGVQERFEFSCMSSQAVVVNASRRMFCTLANSLFNWFKRLVLPKQFQKMQIETLCLKLIKIVTWLIRSARYRSFRFCSNCPYKNEFREIQRNIQQLQIPELDV